MPGASTNPALPVTPPACVEPRSASEAKRRRKMIRIESDAFFASAKQRGNPDAAGRSRESGGAAAASYWAGNLIVRSATASIMARRISLNRQVDRLPSWSRSRMVRCRVSLRPCSLLPPRSKKHRPRETVP